VTRNFSAQIALRHSGLFAKPGDQMEIEKIRSETPHATQEQEVNHLARLAIAEFSLCRSHFSPSVDRLPDYAVHRFRERRACFVHRNIQEAYGGTILLLPSHAPNSQGRISSPRMPANNQTSVRARIISIG
jgi:hypothetical protein